VTLSVNHKPVNSVADFDAAAAGSKGSTLLKTIHLGQLENSPSDGSIVEPSGTARPDWSSVFTFGNQQ
jgi:hypothetical protein